jgi:hypothetical protein
VCEAVNSHIVAVAFAVHVVVPHVLDCLVEHAVVVGVARKHAEVVVCFVLNQRVVPSIADQEVLEIDLVCSTGVQFVLLHKIF